MAHILLVTGNQHKLQEWKRLVPPEVTLDSIDLDLEELQSDDPVALVTDKVKRAYKVVGKPVIVEDVSAGLDALNGLPGPFIKFFLSKLGKEALYTLANKQDGAAATTCCVAAYYDGTHLHTAVGTVHGTVVAPRGESFGFDCTFVPQGYTQTYAEMLVATKDSASHRGAAVSQLISTLKSNELL